MEKRNWFVAVFVVGALISLSAVALNAERKIDPKTLSAPSKKMFAALRSGSAHYCRTVSAAEFNQANIIEPKGPTLISTYGFDGIPALLGGLNNKDAQVRTAVYAELQFSMEGEDIVAKMKANRRWARYPDMVVRALRHQREKDNNALINLNETKRKYKVK